LDDFTSIFPFFSARQHMLSALLREPVDNVFRSGSILLRQFCCPHIWFMQCRLQRAMCIAQ